MRSIRVCFHRERLFGVPRCLRPTTACPRGMMSPQLDFASPSCFRYLRSELPTLTPSNRKMSSDAEYAAFLQKSQKDYSGGQSSDDPWGAGNANVTALEDAHPEIKKLGERFYTSEIDEPFTGVSFVWEKAELPTADEFGSLAGASGGKAVETIAPSKWAGGAYKDVVDAVAASSDGNEVGIYRVERTGSRVEYFVLAVARDHKLAGVKVKAVES